MVNMSFRNNLADFLNNMFTILILFDLMMKNYAV